MTPKLDTAPAIEHDLADQRDHPMLRDHERIAREMSEPVLLRLHRKLERLSSILTVMNTGAHPDDEANGLLAAFRYGFGIRTVIACSTRGEGGQNTIGPERSGIGRAAHARDGRICTCSRCRCRLASAVAPTIPCMISASPRTATILTRWGEDRIVERLVRAYREERPDINSPSSMCPGSTATTGHDASGGNCHCSRR